MHSIVYIRIWSTVADNVFRFCSTFLLQPSLCCLFPNYIYLSSLFLASICTDLFPCFVRVLFPSRRSFPFIFSILHFYTRLLSKQYSSKTYRYSQRANLNMVI